MITLETPDMDGERFVRRCPEHRMEVLGGLADRSKPWCPTGHNPSWWEVWDRVDAKVVGLGGWFKDLLVGWKGYRWRHKRHRVGRPERRRVA